MHIRQACVVSVLGDIVHESNLSNLSEIFYDGDGRSVVMSQTPTTRPCNLGFM